jgi:FkbM family methyltransferase
MISTAPDGSWVVDGDEWLSRWVRESGLDRVGRNDATCMHNVGLLRPGDWVVDGGAALGDHTLQYIKAVGPTGRVIAFEANPEAAECATHNCPGADIHPLGLWHEKSAGQMQANPDQPANLGAAYLVPGPVMPVGLVRLDAFNLPRLRLLKLDIEGAELQALRGARETVERCRPLIQVEAYDQHMARQGYGLPDLLTYFDAHRYDVQAIVGTDMAGPNRELLATPRD